MTTSRDHILRTLKTENYNYSKVAKAFGLPFDALRKHFPQNSHYQLEERIPLPSDIRDLAREPLRQFVIAVKPAGGAWPEKYKDVIAEARRKFDAGTHEMCQGKRGGWTIQYLIPRWVRVPRRRYFSSMVVM